MKNTEKAFLWITTILEEKKINYRITGGFAARVYGVQRELADIDIEVADANIFLLAEEVKPHTVFGPARYKDEKWDLTLMRLLYEGQDIDIAGADGSFFNDSTGKWEHWTVNPEDKTMMSVFGKIIPVESKKSLIAYKTKLGREVDQEDVRQLIALNN